MAERSEAFSNGGRGSNGGGGGMESQRGHAADPSLLTTQQLIRELTGLRELIEARLDGMDKAIELLQKMTDQFPEYVDMKVTHLKDIDEEKFRSIQKQFEERDTRTESTKKDAKDALDAALQAAKEAVEKQNTASALGIAKAETATTKQIDQQALLIQSTASSLDGKITDVKDRLTRIEGVALGSVTAQTSQQTLKDSAQSANGNVVALIASVFGAIGVIAAIAIALLKS